LFSVLVLIALLLFVIMPQERQITALESVTVMFATEAMNAANATGAAACPDPDLRLITPLAGGTAPADEELVIVGTADVAAASRYSVQIRPDTSEQWSTVDTFRRDRALAELGRVDTSDLSPGNYQLLLAARDNQNQIIGETCRISFVLK